MLEDMNGKIDAILDGGSCQVGVESTIIDMTAATPRLLPLLHGPEDGRVQLHLAQDGPQLLQWDASGPQKPGRGGGFPWSCKEHMPQYRGMPGPESRIGWIGKQGRGRV